MYRPLCLLRDLWAWHPPVGTFIGILGLLGVVVPLLRDLTKMGRKEKAAWTLCMFVLLLAELKSLYQDRGEHDREQSESRARSEASFQSIAGGIRESLAESERQFAATMARSNGILSGVNEGIKTQIGGDSFLWYEPTVVAIGDNALPEYKNSLILNAYPLVIGKYSLPFAHVEVLGPKGYLIGGGSGVSSVEYQGMRPSEVLRSRQGLSFKFYPDSDDLFFQIFTNLANGSYSELIELKKVGERWEYESRIYRASGRTPLKEARSKNFPHN
jgi:hypothetical protein